MRSTLTSRRLRTDHSMAMNAVFVVTSFATPAWALAERAAERAPAPTDLAACVVPVQMDGAACEDPVPLAPPVVPAATEPVQIPVPATPAPVASATDLEVERAGVSIGQGEASFYGKGDGFAGRQTANGEIFDPSELTAAHRTLPFGTRLKVTNATNGKSVVVRVNDRGPYAKGRILDLSYSAAQRLGMVSSGHAEVRLERL